MTHPWKIGDWCEHMGARAIVVSLEKDEDAVRLYFKNDWLCTTPGRIPKPLPHCDSWDWQPPSPPDPGEGYRPIDPAVDVPQEGDEFWMAHRRCWRERSTTFCRTLYRNDTHYRRKLTTYAPFTAETFKPHRDRWIGKKGGQPGAFRIEAYDDDGYFIGNEKIPWQDLLDAGYVFDDTNTPCGVPQ